jgi:hypothetical protein
VVGSEAQADAGSLESIVAISAIYLPTLTVGRLSVHINPFERVLSEVKVRFLIGLTATARRRSVNQLAPIPDTTERLVLATGRYIGEGFDDARLPLSRKMRFVIPRRPVMVRRMIKHCRSSREI